jgi:hypothetical protein
MTLMGAQRPGTMILSGSLPFIDGKRTVAQTSEMNDKLRYHVVLTEKQVRPKTGKNLYGQHPLVEAPVRESDPLNQARQPVRKERFV